MFNISIKVSFAFSDTGNLDKELKHETLWERFTKRYIAHPPKKVKAERMIKAWQNNN